MTARNAFIEELQRKTEEHLEMVAKEHADIFSRVTGWGELGRTIYSELQHHFALDGAQEIGGVVVYLESGILNSGTIVVSEREFRGLQLILDRYKGELPRASAERIEEFVSVLRKADRPQ